MIATWILVVLTLMASGYSLSLMCILRRLHRDPRPAAGAVFVLLAMGIMQLTWGLSDHSATTPFHYQVGWLVVDFSTVALIWWLVVMSAVHLRRRKI